MPSVLRHGFAQKILQRGGLLGMIRGHVAELLRIAPQIEKLHGAGREVFDQREFFRAQSETLRILLVTPEGEAARGAVPAQRRQEALALEMVGSFEPQLVEQSRR